MIDHDAVDLVAHIIEPIDDFLQMIVNFVADDEIHRLRRAIGDIELLEPEVVELVAAPLDLRYSLANGGQARHFTVDRLQQWHGLFDEDCRRHNIVGHLLHVRRERAQIEYPNGLRRLLHLIDCIVH
jgi:hypothetical protein